MNHQGRGVGPAGGGRHVNPRTDIEREMPRGIKRKGGAGKSMRLVVVGAGDKPAGQNAEVGRAIAAAAPPFIECCDGGQKLRNGRSCPRSQQLGLRWFVAGAEEPATQPPPALAPCVPVTGFARRSDPGSGPERRRALRARRPVAASRRSWAPEHRSSRR